MLFLCFCVPRIDRCIRDGRLSLSLRRHYFEGTRVDSVKAETFLAAMWTTRRAINRLAFR